MNLVTVKANRFIVSSDHHFCPNEDPVALIKLCERLEPGDVLVFLGDLFDTWYENRFQHKFGYEKLLSVLKNLDTNGVRALLICGNRDFLAGEQLEKASGLDVYQEPILLESDAGKLLALHGDELLSSDQGYQKYKSFVRHPISLALAHRLPSKLLEKIAGGVRRRSVNKIAMTPQSAFQPDFRQLESLILSTRPVAMLAGHLHEERILTMNASGFNCTCTVLPDSTPDRLCYRVWDRKGLSDLTEVRM